MQELEHTLQEAADKLTEEKKKQEKYYHAHRRESQLQDGDVLVWMVNRVLSSAPKGISAKLAPKYRGPYLITEKRGTNTYRLLDADGAVEDIVNAKDLKKFNKLVPKARKILNSPQSQKRLKKKLPLNHY